MQAADYADLVACANDTPYDPMCIYTHGERSERRGVAGPSCPPPTGEGGSEVDMVGRNIAHGCKRPAPRPARRRVGTRLAAGGRNGDRRVDHVDVGAYLAHADSNGLVGPPAGLGNFGRPLRLAFDADGDGRIDLFDWYALQTCFDRGTTRCTYLFDADASAAVDGPDLDAFRASAEPPYSGPPSKPWRRQLVASRYGNPFMWTGQRYDATTGQYHFWARTYSPRLGRWMQRDLLGYVDGLTLYSLVGSRPTNYFDPLGLHYWPPNPFEEYRWPHAGEAAGTSGGALVPLYVFLFVTGGQGETFLDRMGWYIDQHQLSRWLDSVIAAGGFRIEKVIKHPGKPGTTSIWTKLRFGWSARSGMQLGKFFVPFTFFFGGYDWYVFGGAFWHGVGVDHDRVRRRITDEIFRILDDLFFLDDYFYGDPFPPPRPEDLDCTGW